MPLIKGPFNLKWGDNVISGVEEISVDFETDTEEFSSVQGVTYEVSGANKIGVSLTLLASDIPALAALLPQHFVANGQTLSTGETVNHADGAIDVYALGCDSTDVSNNLDIISCGTPADVFRVVNARSRLESVDVDSKIRRVTVRFIGEPDQDEASVQFFKQNTISVVS